MTEREDLKNELLEIAPRLAAMEKNEGYVLPPVYFSSLQPSLKHKLDEKEYLVPNGYFNELKLELPKKVKTKRTLLKRLIPYTAIAASLLLIAFFLTGNDTVYSEENLEEDFALVFLENEIEYFDLEELVFDEEEEEDLAVLEDQLIDEYLESLIFELSESEFLHLIN